MPPADSSPIALWFRHALLPDAWSRNVEIQIAGGRITGVASNVDASQNAARGDIAVAGLPNLHSHAFQRGMAGAAERRQPAGSNFWTWRDDMFRFVERVEPDESEAIAALAYVEMLEAGFTHVGEFHYLHHDRNGRPYSDVGEMMTRIAAAATVSGIGLTLLPVFYAHAGFGGATATPEQRRFLSDLDGFASLDEAAGRLARSLDGASSGVAPHSLRAVTPEELRHLVGLAAGRPVHIHAAEQVREVEDCIAWSGQRPIAWLLSEAGVDDRWCVVHATHMTSEETASLAASGAVAGLCPMTEAHLGDGIFPGAAYADAGGRWGVGSDSNILIDAAAELRALEHSQRLSSRSRSVLAAPDGRSVGRTLYDSAGAGGARALALGSTGLRIGAPADIVELDGSHTSLAGLDGDALLDAWIFSTRHDAVSAVWRWGRQVVHDGRHARRDEVETRYRKALASIRGRS